MPTNGHASTDNYVLEVHEDRLARLDDRTIELSTQLAQLSTSVDHIGQDLRDDIQSVIRKIDESVQPLKERIVRVEAGMGDSTEKVRTLQTKEDERQTRTKKYKKALTWSLAALIGATLGKIGNDLAGWIFG
jgi:chromosome segregation ATPase